MTTFRFVVLRTGFFVVFFVAFLVIAFGFEAAFLMIRLLAVFFFAVFLLVTGMLPTSSRLIDNDYKESRWNEKVCQEAYIRDYRRYFCIFS